MVGKQVIHDAGEEVRVGGKLPKLAWGNAGEAQEGFQASFIGSQKTQHLQANHLGI